jgi:hypothetical protein
MNISYSTGPIENAVATPAISVIIKLLNNSPEESLTAVVKVYALDGNKMEIGNHTFSIPPLASDYISFALNDTKEYEVQLSMDRDEAALASVWGLDADANLIAAQRFISSELKPISAPDSNESKLKFRLSGSKNKKRKLHRR